MISFLRMFTTTRIFIFMLIEVAKDLTSFIVVLVLFLCAFATSNSIIETTETIGFSNFIVDLSD